VALNAAAAKLVGNPKPGEEFQYAGKTWRYGDMVPERYKDARFDIFDKNNTVFSSGELGKPSTAGKEPDEYWNNWKEVSPAEVTTARAAQQAEQQKQIGALDDLNRSTQNPGQMFKILKQTISGVSDSTRTAYLNNFKIELTKYAQNFYGEKDPEKAFQRAVGDANIGTFLQDVGPHGQRCGWSGRCRFEPNEQEQ